jgi:hypothetical protein
MNSRSVIKIALLTAKARIQHSIIGPTYIEKDHHFIDQLIDAYDGRPKPALNPNWGETVVKSKKSS